MKSFKNCSFLTLFTIITLSFSILFVLSSCRKITNGVETGIYVGTFTIDYTDSICSGTTKLELTKKEYKCDGNKDYIPAGGSGHYEIKKGEIIFRDENSYIGMFDWNLLLNGEYEYESKGKKLILRKDNQVYNLERK